MNREAILAKIKDFMSKQQAIVDKAKAENGRTMTEEEITEFNNHQKEIGTLQKELDIVDKLEANNQFMNAPATPPVHPIDMGVQEPVLDDGGFKNLGELACCLKEGDKKGRFKNLVSTDVGILIPPAFQKEVMKLNPESEIVMPRANVIPAGDPPDGPFSIPFMRQGALGALGGVALQWTGEIQVKPTVNDPQLPDMTLEPKEISGLCPVSNKTLRNWAASGSFITNLMQMAFASGRDFAFLRGDGVARPMGIIHAQNAGGIRVNRQTAATVVYLDAVNMLGRLYPEALNGAFWLASITALPAIMTMQDPNGNYMYNAGDASKGIPMSLCGLPLKLTGKMPTVGNEGDLVLCNLNPYYMIKEGSGPYIALSEHVRFTTNETVFRIVANIDGMPWVNEPLLLEDGATTVSPYIILR